MSETPVETKLPPNLFQGKAAVITGASRGVGAATALRLAESGANIVVNYLSREDAANEVVEKCESLGAEAMPCRAMFRFGRTRKTLQIKRLKSSAKLIFSSATPEFGKVRRLKKCRKKRGIKF